ncbi:amino acid permease [Erythrobacter sp. GH3-10]|uniref:Arginine/agmatine antiporter n=2 Tax=Aurantiacibacter rhizosphaerae TaxID=2691582 RepID=A0A844XIE0_9SPHN|nr:amino acid permease [Aurantiacibacter rhizosphaerae]
MMSISLVIGTMIGSGIYFQPSALAPLGWNMVIGWLISGLGALCLAITFRFLMDGTGEGIQHNIERITGEVPGFLAMFSYWAAGFASIAALVIAGGSILADFLFEEPSTSSGVVMAFILLGLITAINLIGTRSAGRMQVLSVAIKIIPLLLVIGALTWFMLGSKPVQPMAPAPVEIDGISGAVALTLFAFLGFETASVPVNKIRNPERNIPIALIGGTSLVLVLYLLVSLGLMLLIPWQDIASSTSPVSDALATVLGPVAGGLVALCILVSVTGCANGLVLIGADCTYSMALRNEMPQLFARTSRDGVRYWGVIVQSVIVALFIIGNTSRGLSAMFTFLALLTTGGILVFYFLAIVAAIKENRTVARWPVMAIGIAFTGLAIYGSGLEVGLWVFALLAIGLALRWYCRRSAVRVPAEGIA